MTTTILTVFFLRHGVESLFFKVSVSLIACDDLYILDYWTFHNYAWIIRCVFCTGGSLFEVKIETDSNGITDQPHDDKLRPYLCTVCDKRFRTKQNLNQHKQTHTGALLFSCTQCEKQFATQRYLARHMNVHSSKYKCTECGKGFSNSHVLTAHRRSHSGEKPFECTVCSKRFARSGNLAAHSRIHSGEKPYKCPTCDKVFRVHAHLSAHMRIHTRDCSLCDKRFSQASDVRRHKSDVHSNRRPYACRYCGKMFCDLKHHVCTHTDVKPYSCRHCSESFAFYVQLKAHLLKSHSQGIWFTCHIC